jgi:hypothetical protein
MPQHHGHRRVRHADPHAPGLPQPLPFTSSDLHDAIPVLARSWSGGRSALGAEGTGKAREPPADGDRHQALASEGLSQRQTRNQYRGQPQLDMRTSSRRTPAHGSVADRADRR